MHFGLPGTADADGLVGFEIPLIVNKITRGRMQDTIWIDGGTLVTFYAEIDTFCMRTVRQSLF